MSTSAFPNKAAEARPDSPSHTYNDGHSCACRHDLHEAAASRDSDQPFLPRFNRKFANPSPAAFLALALGLFSVSIVALGTDHSSTLTIIVAPALGYVAFILLVCGIWEFPIGNSYGAALYLSFAGFFSSLALVLAPWSDVASSYTDASEWPVAVSLYFFAWFISSVVLTVGAHRSSGGLVIFLTMVDFSLLFFGVYFHFPANIHLLRTAGSFGIIAAFVAWYAALSSLLTEGTSVFLLPVLGDFSPKSE